MGQAESAYPRWLPSEFETDEQSLGFLKDEILNLSTKKEAFLEFNDNGLDPKFSLDSYAERIEAILTYDARLPYCTSTFIPKHVTEEIFWSNYFSHVNSLVNKYQQNVRVQVNPSALPIPDSTKKSSLKSKSENDESTMPLPNQSSQLMRLLSKPYVDRLTYKGSEEFGEIRWGIVGLGDVCKVKAGPAFKLCSNSKLVAGCRRDRHKGLEIGSKLGIAPEKIYTDYRDLIRDKDVDAVYIATPVSSHFPIANEALRLNKPCLIEKPICRNSSDSETLAAAFQRASVPLYVAYYRRAHPRFIRVREIIASNALGSLSTIEYRYHGAKHTDPKRDFENDWRIKPRVSGGGYFMDIGCHVIDILDFIFGPLENVQGDALKAEGVFPEELSVETCVTCSFRTHQRALGTMLFNFAATLGSQGDSLRISGTEGMITMSIFGSDAPKVWIPSSTPQGIQLIPTPMQVPKTPKHVHQPLVQCVVNDLLNVPVGQVVSTGESACRTAKIMDSILRRFYKNRNQMSDAS